MYQTTLLLLAAVVISRTAALLQLPPGITKQPLQDELLFTVALKDGVHKEFLIECEADGEPAPTYQWTKNGKDFDVQLYKGRIDQLPGRGTLKFSQPRDEDSGQYQCFAENKWGIATSNSVFVRKAELKSFEKADEQYLEAREGEPFKFTCQPPDSWPKANVYWMLQYGQGQLKTIDDSRRTLDPEGNMWFSNVTKADASAGSGYVCAASNPASGNEYKFSEKVFLTVLPSITPPDENRREPIQQYVSKNNEVALRGVKDFPIYCIYGGTPLPQTIWKKNGVTIHRSERMTPINYNKTLLIKRPSDEDAGDYTCEVSNGVGSTQYHTVSLTIIAMPYFNTVPTHISMAEDETAEIYCNVSGKPTPTISWIHNGKPIEQAASNPRRIVTATSITIHNLVKNDTGNYGCNATNNLGYVYKDVYINVLSIPPEITLKPDNVTIVEGKEAVLQCRIYGVPKPKVKWLHGAEEVTGSRFLVTEVGDLVISEVSFQDSGPYECFAQNKLGNDSEVGSLTVKNRTRIVEKPKDYLVTAGTDATFRCNAVKDESLTLIVTWLYNGQPIDYSKEPRFQIANDNSLFIPKTTEPDSGEYTCVAKTEIDEATAQATLTVQDVPKPPRLTGVECNDEDASIHWHSTGDNRAPILAFIIQYSTSFSPETWNVSYDSVPGNATTYNVALSPWVNYTYRVLARNKIGNSPPSEESAVCSTGPDVPFKNPDNVEGNGTDPTNLVISWTPMPEIEHNAPDFHYLVSWKPSESEEWINEKIPDWQQSQLVIKDQPTFKPYDIKVLAVNVQGPSNVEPLQVTGWSGEDRPLQAPTNFTLVQIITSTTALLSWNPVSADTVQGHFKGYKIQTWTDETGEDQKEDRLIEAKAKQVLVTKLVANTKNYARILVHNSRYEGPPSETLSFVTPEGTPEMVKSFKAYPISHSAMILQWEKPDKPNGVLTGYKVYYREEEGPDDALMQDKVPIIDPKFDRTKLSDLKASTRYVIMIKAMTKAGEGANSTVVQTTRPIVLAQPDVPLFDVTVVPAREGKANVLVQWEPSVDGHSGSQFRVKYRLKGEEEYKETPIEPSEDWILLQGLDPDKVYDVSVVTYEGNYFRESEAREINTIIDGPTIHREEKMATAGWFIGVMLALAFLLLVLVLVCVVRRNRGGKYDVHDRELAHGRRDYGEGGFHEYTHPLDTKSRHSMSSGTKPGPESDTDSLAEYGEGETAGMNEDGSFIGQYGQRRRAPQPDSASQAFATLV